MAIISYDEKPGIQAIATTAPDLPPEPGVHPTFARDHEYKRHGTVSLLAGIDLVTGKVHALVKDRHRSREFIEFLKLLDAAYPAAYRDQADPRQSFRAHLQGDQSLARRPARRAASSSPSRPSTAPGSTSSRASSPSSPARSCATSASPPNRNSRTASWPPWITSTNIPSSTPGPTNSTRPPDMIRTQGNADLGTDRRHGIPRRLGTYIAG